MRTLALSLVSAGLLALTACGGGNEGNHSSVNTLGTDPLGGAPVDNFSTDLGNATDTSNSLGGGTTLGTDANLSANSSAGAANSSATSNSVGNSQ